MVGDLANVHLETGDYKRGATLPVVVVDNFGEIGDSEGEAVSLGSLGLIEQQLGRHEEAISLCQQALTIAREIGYRRGEGYVLTHLGYSYLEVGNVAAARESLNDAAAIRYGLADKVPTLVDDLAALARVELQEGHTARAFAYATEALDRLAEHGPEGVEYPVRDYLECYRVLKAVGSSEAGAQVRAAQALEAGYELLQKLAARLHDPQLRKSFLTNVPFNRELSEAHERRTTI